MKAPDPVVPSSVRELVQETHAIISKGPQAVVLTSGAFVLLEVSQMVIGLGDRLSQRARELPRQGNASTKAAFGEGED